MKSTIPNTSNNTLNSTSNKTSSKSTTYLTAQNLTLAYRSTPLFQQLNFTINRGDKIGLIGHNGCGKSSLLKLLTGHHQSNESKSNEGNVALSKQCLMKYVEQYLPDALQSVSVLTALAEHLSEEEHWRAEVLLAELDFSEAEWHMPVSNCSGGQQMRLLLARAIIHEPDLLLLDEPSNHLDLPSLLWLEGFLQNWKGSFVLVSHDDKLLDAVSNSSWILRDKSLYNFALPCTQARQALAEKDEQDRHRHASEQKEIDRIDKSAKRLANWGKVYDNEDLARKAKTMFARKERLESKQTELSDGTPWELKLQGDALPANRLLKIMPFEVCPPDSAVSLFTMSEQRIKSGDRIAIMGSNGTGKSTLLNVLHQSYLQQLGEDTATVSFDNGDSYDNDRVDKTKVDNDKIRFHPRCRLGYYDQSQQQLNDSDTLSDAIANFVNLANTPHEVCKIALISAGFEYARHGQTVDSLSGGERARLLFVGLTLARFHLLFLDEPTNHLDMEGKEELIATLNDFAGASIIVSHDRNLIEQGCNRFWLIDEQQLVEYDSAEAVYAKLSEQAKMASEVQANETLKPNSSESQVQPTDSQSVDFQAIAIQPEDTLLERLVELETLLEADLNRKAKHQKPKLQQQWRDEIEQIEKELQI